MAVDTSITASTEEIDSASEAAAAALGADVTISADPIEISSAVEGLVIEIPAEGVEAGQAITGDLDFVLGSLTVESTDGEGTATIDLGSGLSVVGDVSLEVTAEGINVEIEDPQLVFEPEAPDAATLIGGSENVTQIGLSLNLELENLPDGASVSVQFAKDASAFVEDAGTVFSLAALGVGGEIEDLEQDVAFVVKITKSVITNQDLGTNTMVMEVSKAWYDQKLAEGKGIFITKIDDEGNVFTLQAACDASGDPVSCTVEFTGAASGLSIFVLVAVVSLPTPTPVPPTATPTPRPTAVPPTPTSTSVPPTATPTARPTAVPSTPTPTPTAPIVVQAPPTATPTATPAPTPTPEPEEAAGAPILLIVGGVLALLLVGGAVVYFVVLRKPSSSPAGTASSE